MYNKEALQQSLFKFEENISRIQESIEKTRDNVAEKKAAIKEERLNPDGSENSVIIWEKEIETNEEEIKNLQQGIAEINEQKFETMFYIKEHERYEKKMKR